MLAMGSLPVPMTCVRLLETSIPKQRGEYVDIPEVPEPQFLHDMRGGRADVVKRSPQ